MRKIHRIKHEERLAQTNKSSSLVFEDPGAAAAYAAQEAFAAGVTPSAVMHTSPSGAGNGDAAQVSPEAPAEAVVPDLEEIQHSEPPASVEEPVEAPEAVEEADEPAEAYEVADQPSEPLAAAEDTSEEDELTPVTSADDDDEDVYEVDGFDAEPEADDQDD